MEMVFGRRPDDNVNAENMSNQLLNFFESDNSALIARFTDLHHTLKCNADKTAAKAVVEELFA